MRSHREWTIDLSPARGPLLRITLWRARGATMCHETRPEYRAAKTQSAGEEAFDEKISRREVDG